MARFNVGDKAVVIPSAFDYGILQNYGFKPNTVYTVSAFINSERDLLWFEELKRSAHQSHFEIYKEEKDMTQQTQRKTKRVAFAHELWEKYKDKDVVVTTLNGRVLEQFTCFNLRDVRVYAGVYTEVAPLVGTYYSHHLFLEIPITTKRIPFNPELKDVKVFTTDSNQSVVDWAMFKDGQVACQWPNQYMGYYPTNLLEMEIEEDV